MFGSAAGTKDRRHAPLKTRFSRSSHSTSHIGHCCTPKASNLRRRSGFATSSPWLSKPVFPLQTSPRSHEVPRTTAQDHISIRLLLDIDYHTRNICAVASLDKLSSHCRIKSCDVLDLDLIVPVQVLFRELCLNFNGFIRPCMSIVFGHAAWHASFL